MARVVDYQNVRVRIDGKAYDIVIGHGLFHGLSNRIKTEYPGFRVAIISDDNPLVLEIAEDLESRLGKVNVNAKTLSFPQGEQNKNGQTVVNLLERMGELRFGRSDTLVVPVGGGVVGDTGGLVAGLYAGGVPHGLIPTTTESMFDESVGGKTGVNLRTGKNMMRVFKQPAFVYADVSTLSTLPDEIYLGGFVEAIKHGVIKDRKFFDYLRRNAESIKRREGDVLMEVVKRNCLIKGNVVEKDPREKGLRRVLNYGHTMAHAIEKVSGYTIPHVKAVSMGMMVAGWIAQIRVPVYIRNFTEQEVREQEGVLKLYGLPTKIPEELKTEDLIAATGIDKKALGGRARYCLPSRIGEMHKFNGRYVTEVNPDLVKDAIERCR